jgi:energy-coupling factor transport system permease protein
MPVLEGALERAVDLAAAMDSRGYGRTGPVSRRARLTATTMLLLGLVGVCVGVYALLDGGTPGAIGLPVLVLGAVTGAAGMVLAGRRSIRTRYRPDPWALPEWLVSVAGAVPAVALIVASALDATALVGQTAPLTWPSLPLLPVVAICVGALPGVVAPLPPGSRAVGLLVPERSTTLEQVAA